MARSTSPRSLPRRSVVCDVRVGAFRLGERVYAKSDMKSKSKSNGYVPLTERDFRLISAADAITQVYEPQWIIEPFLMNGSSMMLYGRQGEGKSRLLWQMAYAIASGEPWLFYEIARPGPVVFLELDMPAAEFRIMMQQAETAGLNHPDIHVLDADDLASEFNIMSTRCLDSLRSWIVDLEPSLLILDTVNDAFYTVKSPDVNAAASMVVRTFRELVNPGAFVYSNHTRKEPSYKPRSDEETTDDDAFLGPGAWERQATSSISIKRAEKYSEIRTFTIKKHRLAQPPVKQFDMHFDKNSFFVSHPSIKQLLLTWPIGAKEPFQPETQVEIIEAVANQMRAKPETVKKALQRLKQSGAVPRWLTELQIDEYAI